MLEVGSIVRTHGLKGEVLVRTFTDRPDWLFDLTVENLYVLDYDRSSNLSSENYKILRITNRRPYKEGALIFFDSCSSLDEALLLCHKKIYLPKKDLISKAGELFYLFELKKFLIKDQNAEVIGFVESFSTNGVQDILICRGRNGQEIPILYIEEYIKNIDFNLHEISVLLPEGYLEIFSK